jgi:hypothetical protein
MTNWYEILKILDKDSITGSNPKLLTKAGLMNSLTEITAAEPGDLRQLVFETRKIRGWFTALKEDAALISQLESDRKSYIQLQNTADSLQVKINALLSEKKWLKELWVKDSSERTSAQIEKVTERLITTNSEWQVTKEKINTQPTSEFKIRLINLTTELLKLNSG